jgi:hypothetical protein
MKHWEEEGVLIELLDRHAAALLRTTDDTLHWALSPFLRFLNSEPVLAGLLDEFERGTDKLIDEQQKALRRVVQATAELLAKHQPDLLVVRDRVRPSIRDGLDFNGLAGRLSAMQGAELLYEVQVRGALDLLRRWFGFGLDNESQEWLSPSLGPGNESLLHLINVERKISLRFERFVKTHPGAAHERICQAIRALDYSATTDVFADEVHNREVTKIRDRIREAEAWGGLLDEELQPNISSLHRAIRTLHLALSTSLGRARSRWATMRRFAARCECFEREQLLREMDTQARKRGAGKRKPEAVLTLAFARYLFDAGYNPLVDAAACGLRPDIFELTAQPAVYVETKQYERVGKGIGNALRRDLAQTITTWARLAKRWHTPEAFLLLFRRSGRSIEIENPEVRWRGGRLYVLVVDLAEAKETGSRAAEPIRLDLHELLPKGRVGMKDGTSTLAANRSGASW